MKNRLRRALLLAPLALLLTGSPAAAQSAQVDRLCDPGGEDCRAILLDYIRRETRGIDVAFWFMEDARYTNELIKRHQAGVRVRVLIDPRANVSYPLNADRLRELQNAGIPMRQWKTNYILHWKMMLFDALDVVEFSGANYSANAWTPLSSTLYENYIDEAIYFTHDPSIVSSFRTKFEDQWTDTNTANVVDYANITGPLVRHYDLFPKDPTLNFPPAENYRTRAVKAYNAARPTTRVRALDGTVENVGIDVIMYRITDRSHTDAILSAVGRGVPVRLITEPKQYRDVTRMWHAWNVDRLYMGGVKIMHRVHQGLNHQKSVIVYDSSSNAGDQPLVIFGSSNWTSPSAAGQLEHNIFTPKPDLVSWFVNQFDRKWFNTAGIVENGPFVPLQPDAPTSPAPVSGATGVPTSVTFTWFGGPWAHLYDVYLSTNPNFTEADKVAADLAETGAKTATSTFSYTHPVTLIQGTTYYWKVVGKTMALQTRSSQTWSFTTEGTAPPPPTTGTAEIVLHAGKATAVAGAWTVESDGTAASGLRIRHPNAGAAKVASASATPANFFELNFYAEAGRAYRLWIRGKADGNSWANDSVFIQFSGSVTSTGSPVWRIGTTSATEMNLENCSGCGLSSWGWQDNAYATTSLGTPVYFEASGQQTIRVQTREDGLAIDQIVLSHTTYFDVSPGTLKNDIVILAESTGLTATTEPTATEPTPTEPSPTDPGEVVLYAAEAPSLAGAWVIEADTTAAGGAKVRHPNAGAGKISSPSAAPVDYFDLTFQAEAGRGYRLWIRGRADSNSWANDSVFVQFDGSVDASSNPVWRIGSTSATEVNIEECSGCGLSGWGWQDNGWGVNVLGPLVYFATTGPQTIRIQTREDGLAIDQVVLSSGTYLNTAPGAAKNDNTTLAKN